MITAQHARLLSQAAAKAAQDAMERENALPTEERIYLLLTRSLTVQNWVRAGEDSIRHPGRHGPSPHLTIPLPSEDVEAFQAALEEMGFSVTVRHLPFGSTHGSYAEVLVYPRYYE